jgi:hypothetical protein
LPFLKRESRARSEQDHHTAQLGIAIAAVIAAVMLTPALYFAWEHYYPSAGPRRDAMNYYIDMLSFNRLGRRYGSIQLVQRSG